MLQRQQIESILKINGVSTASPDEEIRSVLLSARFNEDEIDTAILVLRENKKTNISRVDGLHKVFRSGEALHPSEITSLLGIEVNIVELTNKKINDAKKLILVQGVAIMLIALALASLGILVAMFIYKVGIFHTPIT